MKGFNSATYTATVQVVGSLSAWLYKVPVARNIPPAEMVNGRSCSIIFFDESNRDNAVVAAVYT